MDALKNFLNKKKANAKFKQAGPGHKLSEPSPSVGAEKKRKLSGSGAGGSSVSSGSKASSSKQPSLERTQAANAALQRLEKNRKPTDVDPKDRLAARQAAFIREQALKELAAEREQKQEQEREKKPPESSKQPMDFTVTKKAVVDPKTLAVDGVYYCCPLIGPETGTKEEILKKIEEFLLNQPKEDIALTACLLIHSCNVNREKRSMGIDTLCKYIDNIIGNPEELKFRKIRCQNKAFLERVATLIGFEQFLEAAYFSRSRIKPNEESEPEDFWVFTPPVEEKFIDHLIDLRDMLKNTTPIKPELDRNIKLLMPAQVQQRKELPDEFYCFTKEEILEEYKKRQERLERGLTLRTKAQREKDEYEMKEQRLYKFCIMRIRFPDGLTLQGTFSVSETAVDIYNFVREHLSVDSMLFSLQKAGSEKVQESERTIGELQLAPATIVNFQLESPIEGLNTGEATYLKQETLILASEMTGKEF